MPELKPLEYVSPEEYADAGAGYGRPTRQQVRLGLAQAELRLQILGQEHDKPWIEERGILIFATVVSNTGIWSLKYQQL